MLTDAPYDPTAGGPVNPRASVLIPTHDQPTTLPLTVDTVLRQTVTDLEVILIGDGVTDESTR